MSARDEQINALRDALCPDNNTGLLRYDHRSRTYRLHGTPNEVFAAVAEVYALLIADALRPTS